MKNHPIVFTSLAASLLLGGCVGVGPNTQQGAVAGGAIGALAGAVVGRNSRGRDTMDGAVIGGATIGNSIDNQQGTLYGSPADYRRARPVRYQPPPPPRQGTADMIPPAPASIAVWIAGY